MSATWTPGRAGEVTLRAMVDPDNALGESDEARKNNVIARVVTVAPGSEIRDPHAPPESPPAPPPPPGPRGEPGTKGTCTAWERLVADRGEGLIAMRRARGSPAAFDYGECAKRLAHDVAKAHCTPSDRTHLARKAWYLQPGDLALVPQSVDCR